jgi:hypothetical protein
MPRTSKPSDTRAVVLDPRLIAIADEDLRRRWERISQGDRA